MLNKYKKEGIEYKLLTLAVLAVALFFIIKIVYAGILALPYPKEILEPANVALTNTFLEGYSPYTIASLEREIPGINYDYPFMNSLIAAAIAKIFGCNAVVAHFAVSLTSILASGVIGWAVVSRDSKTSVAPALAGLLFMFCHWRYGYISAAPDDLGLLFFLMTLYAVASPKIKNKPVICGIGITLCFYTKQYFVFVAVPAFIYMLLYSRKEAIKLFVWTVGINAAVGLIITKEWPLYWMKAFAFTYLGAGIGGGFKLRTLIEQLDYIVFSFAALFAVVFVAAFMWIRKMKREKTGLKQIRISENDPFAVSVVSSIVMVLPLYYTGRNDGAMITYFLQLWMPTVAVVALTCIERMLPDDSKVMNDEQIINKINVRRPVYFAVYGVIAAFTLYFGFGRLPLHVLTAEEIANWEKAYDYTREYSENGDVFYSRSLAYDGFIRGNGEWQCGHEGEVRELTISGIINSGLPIELFPHVNQLVEQNVRFRDEIMNKAESGEYSLITFEPSANSTLFDEEFCEEYGYKFIDKLDLQLGNMPYEVIFYGI